MTNVKCRVEELESMLDERLRSVLLTKVGVSTEGNTTSMSSASYRQDHLPSAVEVVSQWICYARTWHIYFSWERWKIWH